MEKDRDEISLFDFAYLGEWGETSARLAQMVLPERWDFAGTGPRRYEILSDYLRFTFLRLEREGKVLISDDEDFCAFNTGLVDESYEDIFACFTPNRNPDRQPWYLEGFAAAGADRLGDRLLRSFHDLPERARYLFKAEDVLYDVDQVLTPDQKRGASPFLQAWGQAAHRRQAMAICKRYNARMKCKSNDSVVYGCKHHVVFCPKYRLRTRIPALWTSSHFVSTVEGAAPLAVARQCIENQKGV